MSGIQGLEQILRAKVSVKLLEEIENPEFICDRLGEINENFSTAGIINQFAAKVAFEHNQDIFTFTELPSGFVDNSYGDIVTEIYVHADDLRKLCSAVRAFNKNFLKYWRLDKLEPILRDVDLAHVGWEKNREAVDKACDILGLVNPFEYDED